MNLTTKFMEENLASGWTIKDFSNHFQISENDFIKLLEKTFLKKPYLNSIKIRLKKNEKKSMIANPKPITSTPKNEEDILNSEERLKKLHDREKVLRHIIERNTKFFNDSISYIEYKKGKMAEAEIRYRDYVADALSKISINEANAKKFKENIIKQTEELENVLSEIRKLSIVNISVSENGEFLIEDDTIEIPKDWQLICFDIMVNKDFENLNIAQMNSIAKILKLTIERTDLNFKISFKSKQMQECFDWIKSQKQ